MATGTSSGTVERIREELICAVCLDILREPKVLQCAHSFCRECLEKIVAQRQQPAPNYTAEPDEGKVAVVTFVLLWGVRKYMHIV